MLTQKEKNNKIASTMAETHKRRQSQTCVSIKLKVNRKMLRKEQLSIIENMFYEAKCVYNYALGKDMIYGYSHQDFKHITKLDKDDNEVPVDIEYLPAAMIQQIIDRMQDSCKALKRLKEKDHKVGGLKFKSEWRSLLFKQYGVTHYIKGNRIKLQGIKRHIRVEGIEQLRRFNDPEITTAQIYFDGYDYWIILSVHVDKSYLNREISEKNIIKRDYIGIDLGTADTVSLSTGEKIDVEVKETERISKLMTKLDRKVKCSNNWYKTKSLLNKEYAKLNHRKKDKANKLVHHILSNGKTIIIQNDNLSSWKDNKSHTQRAKKIHHSVLGTVKTKLMQYPQVVVLDRWFPTTKHCFECGHNHDNLKLEDRIFVCPKCGFTHDRDLHAAENMIQFYLKYKDAVGTTGTLKLSGRKEIKYSEFKRVLKENVCKQPKEGTMSSALY